MKKKKINIFKVIFALIILAILTIGIIIAVNEAKIKKNYNKYVVVSVDSDLYNSKNKKVGKIYKDTYLELDKYKSGKYYKIKGTDYYVYYSSVKKSNKKESNIKDYYVTIGFAITLKDNTDFYIDDKAMFRLNKGIRFEVLKQDDNYYYVRFLNNMYGIKKDAVKSQTEIKIDKKDYMSVLYFEKTNDNIEAQFNYLRENDNFGITLDDFKLWFEGKININRNGLLILSKDAEVLKIAKKNGIYVEENYGDYNYISNNTSTKQGSNNGISMYNITLETTNETLKSIINGEPIAYIDLTTNYAHNLRSDEGNASSIAVLNYHFFYDSSLGEYCGEGNCMDTKDFEKELYYLKVNGWKTLTMDEFIKWMYGEIELPNKSVLLTVDDGAMGTGIDNGNKLMPLLEKYDLHATLFLISGWHKYQNYISPNLDVESHTYNMHSGGACDSEARGSKLLCSSREEIKEDLTISKNEIGTNNAFCYPMYVYNDKVISVLKEMGYKVAFTGGDYKASRDDDKYKIPRYHIYDSTTLDEFIDMIN